MHRYGRLASNGIDCMPGCASPSHCRARLQIFSWRTKTAQLNAPSPRGEDVDEQVQGDEEFAEEI